MRIFHIIPAPEWAAVYIDVAQVTPLSPWQAEDDRPPESLPLVRVPLVCWAHLEDPMGRQWYAPDGTLEPYRYICGMEARTSPDGEAQIAPSGGDLLVGYLQASQPLSTLAAHAQLVWEVYDPDARAGRQQAEDDIP